MNLVIRPEEKMFKLTLTKESALQLLFIFNEHGDSAQEDGLLIVQEATKGLKAIILHKLDKEHELSYSKEATLDLVLFLREFHAINQSPAPSVLVAMTLMEEFLVGGNGVQK